MKRAAVAGSDGPSLVEPTKAHRHVRALMVAIAAATVHCAAGEAAPNEPDDSDASTIRAARPRGRGAKASEGAPTVEVLSLPPGRPSVTSTALGDDGTIYVAGLFSGVMSEGHVVLESRGDEDVFLARVDSNGTVAWARAVGSRQAEHGPRVTFGDHRVKLLALTRGEVDCGRGPLRVWTSEMFFLCVFDPDGRLVEGGAFPTGRP